MFNAHQLGLSLRTGAICENPSLDPGPAGFEYGDYEARAMLRT